MVKPKECLQIVKNAEVICRYNPEYFPPEGIDSNCPFSECIALKVLSDESLFVRVFGPDYDRNEIPEKEIIRTIAHCVCPGTRNPKKSESIIYKYTKENPFVSTI